ncbi:hypothetical protein SpCBS45565_g03337 [Spizellomyces sp. 'palustris']|nr:hypothetical protein SpCBS45565_g03337 [Spizellomyces sp. 'palustris']
MLPLLVFPLLIVAFFTGPLVYLLFLFSRPTSAFRSSFIPQPLRPPLKQFNRLSVLLVTAHPDDECMFFGPTIVQLIEHGAEVAVLCLSSGNADGIGTVRKKELLESCKKLGIHSSNVTCLDHPQLQDDPKAWWKVSVIAEVLDAHIAERKVDVVITFDNGGISGHPNHRALFEGIRYFLNLPASSSTSPRRQIPLCYALKTVSLLRKYLFIGDLGLTVVPHLLFRARDGMKSHSAVFVATPQQFLQARTAMTRHKSQLVWFRYLYILFSRYMIVNELERI